MISTITLDTYKQQISSGDAFNLSDSFNGRVGDEQVPLVVQFKERGLAQQFQDGLVPFMSGFVGSLDETGIVTAETGEAVSYTGSSDDVVGLGRVKMNLPGTMFPQEGYFYGFLGLQTADGSKRITTFNVWFHVYNGNPDMFVNKAPFRSELQKLLDATQLLLDQTTAKIADQFATWTNEYSSIQQIVTALNSQLTDLAQKIKDNNVVTKAEFAEAQATIDEISSGWNNYKNTNVVTAGIDNTGTKDITTDLQDLVDSGTYGVYFPAGVYNISAPIKFPYGTNYPYAVELNANAHIVALAPMDAMFQLGEKQTVPDKLSYLDNAHYSELYKLVGGYFHGNLNAKVAIQTGQNMKGFKIESTTVDGCLEKNIYLKKSAVSDSHDAVVDNVRINYVNANADASRNAVGIYAETGDWSLSNTYISDCGIAVKSLGYLSISDCHLFNGWDGSPSIGVQCPGGLLASNLYVDCYNTAISTLKDDGTYAPAFIDLLNFYYYEFTGHSTAAPIHVIDTIDTSTVNIANIQTVFSDKRANDGSQVIYVRQADAQQALSSKLSELSAVGISSIGKPAKIAGDTNTIGDMLYSGVNRNNVSYMVTPGLTLTPQTGTVIGWVPYPSGPNPNSTQTFRMETDNKYYNVTATLRVYLDDQGNLKQDNGGYVKVIADNSAKTLHYGIGAVQTINGKKLLPIYLYYAGSGTYYLDRLTITTIGMSSSGFLFPFNNVSDPVKVVTSSLVLSDELKTISLDYDSDNMKYPTGAWLATDSTTSLFNLTTRGIYQFGGTINWTGGPSDLNGLERYGYIQVITAGGCTFIRIVTNFDEVYLKNRSGTPATWSSWRKATITAV